MFPVSKKRDRSLTSEQKSEAASCGPDRVFKSYGRFNYWLMHQFYRLQLPHERTPRMPCLASQTQGGVAALWSGTPVSWAHCTPAQVPAYQSAAFISLNTSELGRKVKNRYPQTRNSRQPGWAGNFERSCFQPQGWSHHSGKHHLIQRNASATAAPWPNPESWCGSTIWWRS